MTIVAGVLGSSFQPVSFLKRALSQSELGRVASYGLMVVLMGDNAVQSLDALTDHQTWAAVAIPLVFALGLSLVTFFHAVLRSYRRRAEGAATGETLAVRRNQRRLCSLIQNASDVILICQPSGLTTYQSPATEAGWDYVDGKVLAALSLPCWASQPLIAR